MGQLEKKLFLTFFQLKCFLVFFFKFLSIVCLDRIQKSHIFYKKKLQSLTPNCPGPGICLSLMFGQTIVIRVLMLNF